MKNAIGETEMKKKRKQNTEQDVVSTPLWLQRRMLRNLTQASKNKVSPSRAKTAKAVLQAIDEADEPVQTSTLSVEKPATAKAGKHESAAVKRSSSRIRKILKVAVTKYAGGVKKFADTFRRRDRNKKTAVFSPNPVGRRTKQRFAS